MSKLSITAVSEKRNDSGYCLIIQSKDTLVCVDFALNDLIYFDQYFNKQYSNSIKTVILAVTHTHSDHSSGLTRLGSQVNYLCKNAKIFTIAGEVVLNSVKTQLRIEGNTDLTPFNCVPNYRSKCLDISPVPLPHGDGIWKNMPNTGIYFIFKKHDKEYPILGLGDSSQFPEQDPGMLVFSAPRMESANKMSYVTGNSKIEERKGTNAAFIDLSNGSDVHFSVDLEDIDRVTSDSKSEKEVNNA